MRKRTIGEFLCHHSSETPFENVDVPSSRDIRQDAALRAVLGLRKLGKSVSHDAVAAFDAEPKIAAQAYRWARNDALRKHLGRGKQPRPGVQRRIPGDDGATGDIAERIADPAQRTTLEAVEDDYSGKLRRLWDTGIEGLTLSQSRQAIWLMWQIQRIKDRGAGRVPDKLRQQVSRLRRETGLSLNTKLL